MKIFILNVPAMLQPLKQGFKYPGHNKDYGVEQDFLIWLNAHPSLLCNDPEEAVYHYLPVYWTRWHITHNFAVDGNGLETLSTEVDKAILDNKKTFTITQFDGGTLLQPGKMTEFTAARTINSGLDIPILCSKHKKPPLPVRKKYLASFNGTYSTHPIRTEMAELFNGNPEILIGGGVPTRFYKRWLWAKNYNLNTMASYIALCPRGTSCNSFRFFEAMQLGVAPCLVGDVDVRPFKEFIAWNDISYYAATVNELDYLLKHLDKDEALQKGKKALQYFNDELYYQKWCKYIIMELEALKSRPAIVTNKSN
ncbi:hypothetical protein A0256_10545 [Mucilaginibacter sp. PAMC 26640]|nr:hypothetical protein A0256_10545 [Mucilaginibacter sp. PAMC 26640]